MVKANFEGKELECPDDLLYLKTHQWVNLGDGKVGITDYAQDQLGDINFCDVDGVKGTELSQVMMKGEKADSEPIDIVVESSKAVGEIYSPLSGKVIAINSYVMEDPKKINSDPYGVGWLFQLETSKADEEKSNLLTATDYAEFVSK